MVKRFFLAFCLLLACSVGTLATDISVSGFQINNFNRPGTTAQIRIWYSSPNGQNIVDSNGVPIIVGAAGTGPVYAIITATLNPTTHVLTIPSFTIPSTNDSSQPSSKVTARIYDAAGTPITYLWTNWIIPYQLGSTVTFAQLNTYQPNPANRPPTPGYPTTDQVLSLINAVQPCAKSSDATIGCLRLSAAPVSAINPIAVGDNDTRITGLESAASGIKVKTQIEANRAIIKFTPEPTPSALIATQGAAGLVDVGEHDYAVTFVTANGETDGSPPTTTVIVSSAKQVSLTIPTGSSFVTARKIWRSKASGDLFETDHYYLVTALADNTTTTFNDNVPDSGLGVAGGLLDNGTTSTTFKVGSTRSGFLGPTNTLWGFNSLGSISGSSNSGSYNSAFGARVMPNITTGSFNAGGGYEALQANTTGLQNTGFGSQAGQSNSTGNNNSAFGQASLMNNLNSGNTAIGSFAMWFPQNSTENSAFGLNAMRGGLSSTGSYNLAAGAGALYSFTTAQGNVGAGWNALASLTTGNNNVGVGFQAGYRLALGAGNNVFVGANAGLGNAAGATGANNVAVGKDSFSGGTSGSENTAVGGFSLNAATTGTDNVGAGYQSLVFNITGNKNVAVGRDALSGTTASNNVAVGYAAGNTNTSGTGNLFLGHDADATAGNLTNASAIGAGASVGLSNTMVLGTSSIAVQAPGTLAVGGGTALVKILKGTVTVDPASINATTVSSQTFTLTGAVVGDSLTLNPPAAGLTAGLLVAQCFVSAADTITIVFYNTTGAPVDQASSSWTYKLVR